MKNSFSRDKIQKRSLHNKNTGGAAGLKSTNHRRNCMKKALIAVFLVIALFGFTGCDIIMGILGISTGSVDLTASISVVSNDRVEITIFYTGTEPAVDVSYLVVLTTNPTSFGLQDPKVHDGYTDVAAGYSSSIIVYFDDFTLTGIDPDDYYIGVIVDPNNYQAEDIETNNKARTSGTFYFGGTGGTTDPLEDDASLSNLTVSYGSLTPAFSAGTTTYSVDVANNINFISVTPTVNHHEATVTVNNSAVNSGSPSSPIALNVGANTINVEVTAENGDVETYTITATRAAPPIVGSGTQADPFVISSNGIWVPSEITSNDGTWFVFEVVPESNYTVNWDDSWSGSGDYSLDISMSAYLEDQTTPYASLSGIDTGYNTDFNVTPSAGTTQVFLHAIPYSSDNTGTFAVKVFGDIPVLSDDATLSNLSVSAGTLDPAFSTYTFAYAAGVENGVADIAVTATSSDIGATVTIDGSTVSSGAASQPINLSVGDNQIDIVVTAENGMNTETYTINVNRAEPPITGSGTLADPYVISTNDVWIPGEITSDDGVWYTFAVVPESTYTVNWDDSYQGTTASTVDIKMSAYHEDQTTPYTSLSGVDSGFNTGVDITPQAGSMQIFLHAIPYYTGNIGTFAVKVFGEIPTTGSLTGTIY
jgi:hypothetical protein